MRHEQNIAAASLAAVVVWSSIALIVLLTCSASRLLPSAFAMNGPVGMHLLLGL